MSNQKPKTNSTPAVHHADDDKLCLLNQRRAKTEICENLPDRLDTFGRTTFQRKQVTLATMPSMFQLRGELQVDFRHRDRLCRALVVEGGDLPPILVWRCADKAFVLDGHHRLEAYKKNGLADIPVKWFDGSAEDAMLKAAQANSRDKLPMWDEAKRDAAWRMVCWTTAPSKRQIMLATGTSMATIGRMRRAWKQIQMQADSDVVTVKSWKTAQMLAKGFDVNDAEHDHDEMERRCQEDARKLVKVFGRERMKPKHALMLARALELAMGSGNVPNFCRVLDGLGENKPLPQLLGDQTEQAKQDLDNFKLGGEDDESDANRDYLAAFGSESEAAFAKERRDVNAHMMGLATDDTVSYQHAVGALTSIHIDRETSDKIMKVIQSKPIAPATQRSRMEEIEAEADRAFELSRNGFC